MDSYFSGRSLQDSSPPAVARRSIRQMFVTWHSGCNEAGQHCPGSVGGMRERTSEGIRQLSGQCYPNIARGPAAKLQSGPRHLSGISGHVRKRLHPRKPEPGMVGTVQTTTPDSSEFSAQSQGLSTTLMQPSSLSRKVLYISGPLESGTLWVMTNDGSMSPPSIRRRSGSR
jgi:hypothetical protein